MLTRVLTTLLEPFCWRQIGVRGVYVYFENRLTGRRMAFKTTDSFGVVNDRWVRRETDQL